MAGLILAVFTAGLLVLYGRVFFHWLRERRADPRPRIPFRYHLYGLLGTAAGIALLFIFDFRYESVVFLVLWLVPWMIYLLLKGLDDLFRWLRRDERPPGIDDFANADNRSRQPRDH